MNLSQPDAGHLYYTVPKQSKNQVEMAACSLIIHSP